MDSQIIMVHLPPDTMAALQVMAADQQKPIDQVIVGLIDNAPMVGRKTGDGKC